MIAYIDETREMCTGENEHNTDLSDRDAAAGGGGGELSPASSISGVVALWLDRLQKPPGRFAG